DSWCPGRAVFLTTCLIHPPHLPGGRLARGHFPLVICPRRTDVAAMLPGTLWPAALREEWVSSEQRSIPDGGRPR
ncbi:MAG TPA: hypothetical protein VFA18_03215, partial [Gemmataceae bacterium]|nr:hypothetical protein [Gemmataceae bacterium]